MENVSITDNMSIEVIKIVIPAIVALLSVAIGAILTLLVQKKIKIFDFFLNEKERKEEESKFYLQLLRYLYDLDDRLKRILQNLHTDWLDSKYLNEIKTHKGFAENPKNKGYLFISTIYMIGCFFGVTAMIRKRVDIKRNSVEKRKHNKIDIFQFDQNIKIISRLFQDTKLFEKYCRNKNFADYKDANIYKHFQHSIGEIMIEKISETNYRVKSFKEFYESYINEESFRFWFILIEEYFTNLCNFETNKELEKQAELKNDIRPLRLIAIQYWCRRLMERILEESNAIELSFENRKPDDLLNEKLSEELKELISNYNLKVTNNIYQE